MMQAPPHMGPPGPMSQQSQQLMMDKNSGSPDFVKKLFKMLEEHEYENIVRWNELGDSFIVLDTNEFTKTILPRHFKHSNFASFVRQLNKYDFHKVRNTGENGEGNPYGEGTWEFKHENFRIHNKDSLDNIKRKAPTGKRGGKADGMMMGGGAGGGMMENGQAFPGQIHHMQHQIETLHKMCTGMGQHLQTLTKNYQSVISEMLNFQRNMVAQDQLMQNLIGYMMNGGSDGNPNPPMQGAALPAAAAAAAEQHHQFQARPGDEHAQKLIDDYTQYAKASYEQMNNMSRRASTMGLTLEADSQFWNQHHDPMPPAPLEHQGRSSHYSYSDESSSMHTGGSPSGNTPGAYQQQQQQQHQQPQRTSPNVQSVRNTPSIAASSVRGAKEELIDPLTVLPGGPNGPGRPQSGPGGPGAPGSNGPNGAGKSAQAIKSSFVPWVVPPKVLLVEDDAVCRRLSSKFLSIFGCEIDMAVDGVSAVNKMNQTKYDLVLMDIVMPNLDGVSATSLIRQFDPLTPIISMTSNVQSGDVMTYFSHGMNDVLPKPFTKDGLLGMLEKHLIHLKTLKLHGSIPRAMLEGPNGTFGQSKGLEEDDGTAAGGLPPGVSSSSNNNGNGNGNGNGVDGAAPRLPEQSNSAFNVTEAEYLGMLSGLVAGQGVRRTADQMDGVGVGDGSGMGGGDHNLQQGKQPPAGWPEANRMEAGQHPMKKARVDE